MKGMKNIMTIKDFNKVEEITFDSVINEMYGWTDNKPYGINNVGIKIVAILYDVFDNKIIVRRNKRTEGFIDHESKTHAEYLCLKSTEYKSHKLVNRIFISKPPCEKCMSLIQTMHSIENIYYLYDINNAANEKWNIDKVDAIDKKMISKNSIKLINIMKEEHINELKISKKRPRPIQKKGGKHGAKTRTKTYSW